ARSASPERRRRHLRHYRPDHSSAGTGHAPVGRGNGRHHVRRADGGPPLVARVAPVQRTSLSEALSLGQPRRDWSLHILVNARDDAIAVSVDARAETAPASSATASERPAPNTPRCRSPKAPRLSESENRSPAVAAALAPAARAV